HGEEIDCQVVGLTAGVSPNIDFLNSSKIELKRGILVDKHLQTNIEGVYAIGDCAEFIQNPASDRKNIEQVWYTGKIMGKTLATTICKEKVVYDPGHWFNSAKFMDIEYQTYGWVFPEPKEGEEHFYWEHFKGKKSIRLCFESDSRKFVGVNCFGIRLRHQAFDKWLNEASSIEYVVEHLKDANFDPELYKQHELEIVTKFNAEQGTTITPRKRNWKNLFTTK
ncbi:MAG: NADPH-dependent 2,4-dienoyl-CoA reductase/sulfur reductase-like enzyme, partial [Parvicella sp.]